MLVASNIAMAYIKVRKKLDGSTRYTAIVRRRVGKAIVHQEARTFTHRAAALTWAKHREVELEDPAALKREYHAPVTLAELLRWYIDTFGTISKWQRSKQSHLEFLERHALGRMNALHLTAAALINHVVAVNSATVDSDVASPYRRRVVVHRRSILAGLAGLGAGTACPPFARRVGAQESAPSAVGDTVAVLGTGHFGGAIGRRLAEVGHTVVYGSRTPDSQRIKALVRECGRALPRRR